MIELFNATIMIIIMLFDPPKSNYFYYLKMQFRVLFDKCSNFLSQQTLFLLLLMPMKKLMASLNY
jgi:hypothetical protein